MGKQIAEAVVSVPRVTTKPSDTQIGISENKQPATPIALAFQKEIRATKENLGTYAGNPQTMGEIKNDLHKLGVTKNKPGAKRNRVHTKANGGTARKVVAPRYAKENTGTPVKQGTLLPYILKRKIESAEREIASLKKRVAVAKERGDTDTVKWAENRINQETAKLGVAQGMLREGKQKRAAQKKPIPVRTAKETKETSPGLAQEVKETYTNPYQTNTTFSMSKENPFAEPLTPATAGRIEGAVAEHTVRSLLGHNTPEQLIAMIEKVRAEKSQAGGEEKRNIETELETLSRGDSTPSTRARMERLETRLAELDMTGGNPVEMPAGAPKTEARDAVVSENAPALSARELRAREFAESVSGRTHLLPFDTITVQRTNGAIENDWVIQYIDPYTNEVTVRKYQDDGATFTKVIPIEDAERLNPRSETTPQQIPERPVTPTQESVAGQLPANPETPQIPAQQITSSEQAPPGGGGRPPEGPPAGVAFQRDVVETFEREHTVGQRIGSWLKERMKGLITFGWWETHVAEKIRTGTKKIGGDMEAQSRLVRQEEGLLPQEEALAEATRIRELFAMSNMEAPSAGQYEGLSQLVTSEKISANRHIEDTMVAEALGKIEERFGKTKRYNGTPAVTPESMRAIENRIRNSVRAMRRGQADDDILNFTRRVRGALDPEWYKRYVATGVEMALGAVALKWAVTYMAGGFGGADPTTVVEGAREVTRGLKDTIWGEAKRILMEKGVPRPTDGQIMELSKTIAADSKVGVDIWNMQGTPLDVQGKAGMLLNVGRAIAMAARMAGGV